MLRICYADAGRRNLGRRCDNRRRQRQFASAPSADSWRIVCQWPQTTRDGASLWGRMKCRCHPSSNKQANPAAPFRPRHPELCSDPWPHPTGERQPARPDHMTEPLNPQGLSVDAATARVRDVHISGYDDAWRTYISPIQNILRLKLSPRALVNRVRAIKENTSQYTGLINESIERVA